ncbi:hypothetical protein EIP91_011110 [Steccherinum ochraceum]|uniref:RRM domain-containing protein n=1 Tax=Steccherinum ochraceum TaxID=92696 RepID=A0A4R0RYJ8_9APHY|nr:hypothetical protein EIP91_011110 [Steccherinum ochraceum]
MADNTDTTPTVAASDAIVDDADEEESKEILLMKQRVEEMEREANKLRELQAAAENAEGGEGDASEGGAAMDTDEDRAQADSRSVFIGNVDYGSTPEEIQQHFQACGTINRVTILCDKFTGHPKGFAYVEFAEPEFIDAALAMDNSLFRGRLIKVSTVLPDHSYHDISFEHRSPPNVPIFTVSTEVEDEGDTAVAIEEASGEEEVTAHTEPVGVTTFKPQSHPRRQLTTMLSLNPLRTWAKRTYATVASTSKAPATTTSAYPFSKSAIIQPSSRAAVPEGLKLGKGLMTHLRQTLPTPQKQKLLTTLFAKRHPLRLSPGSVLTVKLMHAPATFSGVLVSVRRRGLDTSFVLRNVISRTGVEMQFFVNSPHLKDVQVISRANSWAGTGKKDAVKIRRAKLFYLRDSPEKMTAISAGVRG